MRSTNTTKRTRFSSSRLASDHNHLSQISKFIDTNINDLPEDALLDIFYRLGCSKFVARGKCVSKRWCNLMSDPSFIGTFVRFKSDKHAPIKHSLLHSSGVEFLGRMSTSTELLGRMSTSTEPLTPLFQGLMSSHSLNEEPVIVGSYNDLILCSVNIDDDQPECYFICNPFTVEWVSLPPPPQVYDECTPVGFVCDHPYYHWSTGDQGETVFNLNAEYRCRVVRLVCPEDQKQTLLNEFKVQIFSSETGEWVETIISSPSPFYFEDIDFSTSYANKGMLYWHGYTDRDEDMLIGFNPFTINSRNSSCLSSTSSTSANGGDIHNKCCFIALWQNNEFQVFKPLGVYKGCMQLYEYDITTHTLYVADLNEEEIPKVRLDRMRVYTLNGEMIPDSNTVITILGFDPDDDDILYVVRSIHKIRDIFQYNVRTRAWLMVAEKTKSFLNGVYPIVVPVMPTPIRILAQH